MLLLRNRYDVRGGLLLFSMALRLAAVAIGASIGLVETFVAIVVAQCISTATISAVALAVVRRYPHAEPERLGEDRRPIVSFAIQSSVASGLTSLRGLLPTVLVGVVARADAGRALSHRAGAADRVRDALRARCGSCSSPSRRATSSMDAATGPVACSFAGT